MPGALLLRAFLFALAHFFDGEKAGFEDLQYRVYEMVTILP